MEAKVLPGEAVQTPLGKGVVREIRNNGRVLVHVQGRAVVIPARDISRLGERRTRQEDVGSGLESSRVSRSDTPDRGQSRGSRPDPDPVDLHGLTVEEAMARVDAALNQALLGDVPALRIIHGRSGGRIRAALHERLRGIRAVRTFRLDPRNPGVTIVEL